MHSTLKGKLVNVRPTNLISPIYHSEFCDFAMVGRVT